MESEIVQVPHFTHEFSLTNKNEDTVKTSAPINFTDEEIKEADKIGKLLQETFHFKKEDKGILTYGRKDIEYTVKGLKTGTMIDLNIVLKISNNENGLRHLSSVNLLNDRDKFRFAAHAREKLFVSETEVLSDLENLTVELEERQEALYMKQNSEVDEIKRVPHIILPDDYTRAVDLLSKRDYLTETLLKDLASMGIVGEERNKQVMLCAGISRRDLSPLHILYVASPGTGKSVTQRAVVELFPLSDWIRISRSTSQVLFYVDRTLLSGIILSLDEVDGMGENIYPYRTLMSERKLELLSTGKDQTGNHKAFRRVVEGSCSVFLATTDINKIDPETRSRMLIIYGDESPEQTRRIMEAQIFFNTKAGRKNRDEFPLIIKRNRDMLHLIEAVPVEFSNTSLMEHVAKRHEYLSERRNFLGFLTLLNSIARSRMYQRKLIDGCVLITKEDVDLAELLTKDIFSAQRCALSGPIQLFYNQIVVFVDLHRGDLKRTEFDFTSRDIREYLGMGHSQVFENLKNLVRLEYITRSKTSRGHFTKYRLADEN